MIAQLRYGRLGYVNVAPVETAFDRGAIAREAHVVTGTPAELNAGLLSGELDVSAVSAAAYLTNRETLELLGDLCIASDGPVRSVLLVSPVPPALLGGAAIAVTAQSASGRSLLAALLRNVHGLEPSYEIVGDALAAARAGRPALVIGDEAIVARTACRPSTIYDLGEAWQSWTGLPFVFAVWAVRRDVLMARPADVATLAAALERGRTWGAHNPAAVIDAAIAQRPFHRAFYADYFTRLRYRLDERARLGLERFAGLLTTAAAADGNADAKDAPRVAR